MSVFYKCRCWCCGKTYRSCRPHGKTCSVNCRKRWSRYCNGQRQFSESNLFKLEYMAHTPVMIVGGQGEV